MNAVDNLPREVLVGFASLRRPRGPLCDIEGVHRKFMN